MGTEMAIRQIEDSTKLHSISFTPIHKSIQHILPYLEQRQECAKRLYEYRNKLTEAEKLNYEELIKRCESEISTILNFIS